MQNLYRIVETRAKLGEYAASDLSTTDLTRALNARKRALGVAKAKTYERRQEEPVDVQRSPTPSPPLRHKQSGPRD